MINMNIARVDVITIKMCTIHNIVVGTRNKVQTSVQALLKLSNNKIRNNKVTTPWLAAARIKYAILQYYY